MPQPPNKAVTTSHRGLFRSSGIASICAGILILIAFTLIATMGNPTPTGEGYLNYYAAHTWTATLTPWLFILSDALLLPVLASLYLTLREVNKSATPVALGFLGLFVIMDLINLSNVLSFISISEHYAAATSDAQRLAIVAVADYLYSLQAVSQPLFSYAFSGVGLLIAGLIMLRGVFGKATAYAGIAAGVLGVLGLISIPVPGLMVVCILDLVLWGIWAMLLGRDLIILGK